MRASTASRAAGGVGAVPRVTQVPRYLQDTFRGRALHSSTHQGCAIRTFCVSLCGCAHHCRTRQPFQTMGERKVRLPYPGWLASYFNHMIIDATPLVSLHVIPADRRRCNWVSGMPWRWLMDHACDIGTWRCVTICTHSPLRLCVSRQGQGQKGQGRRQEGSGKGQEGWRQEGRRRGGRRHVAQRRQQLAASPGPCYCQVALRHGGAGKADRAELHAAGLPQQPFVLPGARCTRPRDNPGWWEHRQPRTYI